MRFRCKLMWLPLAFIALSNLNNANAAKTKKVNFNEFEVETEFKLIHPVINADILSNEFKELVILGVDKQGQRWLVIYHLDPIEKKYKVADKNIIPKEFYSFDLGNYHEGKLQKLFFMSSNALFEYSSGKFNQITEVDSIYLKEKSDHIIRGEFVTDLNGDNFDDIIIPDFKKTHLLTGKANGDMLKQSIPIEPTINIYDDGASYTQSKLYFFDVNFDQYIDIIKPGEGELIVYRQDPQGMFSQTPVTLAINSDISAIQWWDKKDDAGDNLDQSKLIYRNLEELRDIDNDGNLDLIVRFTQSSGVLDRTNDYEVYLGKNVNGKLTFDNEASSVIHADGTLTGLEFVDINNDKKSEVLLAGFDIGLSQIIGALVAGSIDQDVHLFKMDQNNNFAKKPSVSKEVDLNFSLSSGRSGSAVVKLADINGDGFKDLILSEDDDMLKIYFGQSGEKPFVRRSARYKTQLPLDGEVMQVADLNNDGKDDLFLKYGHLDDASLNNKFKVLLSL